VSNIVIVSFLNIIFKRGNSSKLLKEFKGKKNLVKTLKNFLNLFLFSIFKHSSSFFLYPLLYFHVLLQRGSDELLSQTAVMAPAADNNNQDLATKKAKLDSNTVIGGVGE